MSILEVITIFIETVLMALVTISPLIFPMVWPKICAVIYKFACYMADGQDEYDANGDYITSAN